MSKFVLISDIYCSIETTWCIDEYSGSKIKSINKFWLCACKNSTKNMLFCFLAKE